MNEATKAAESPPAGLMPRLRGWVEAKRKEIVRFVKFTVVGTIGAVVDFGTFNLLNALGWLEPVNLQFPFNVRLTGVGVAGMISLCMAIISNFMWNRYWTYPDSRSKNVVGQLAMFFAINVTGLVIRLPLLEVLRRPLAELAADTLGVQPGLATTIGNNAALVIAVTIVLFWNFFVNRYLTYSDVE